MSHKQIVRSVVLLVVMLLVIGCDDCVGIMVSGNLVTVTVRARPGLQVLICSGIKEHTGHGLIDMIREIKF